MELICLIVTILFIIFILTRSSTFSSIEKQLQQGYSKTSDNCFPDNRVFPSGKIPAYGYLVNDKNAEQELLRTFPQS